MVIDELEKLLEQRNALIEAALSKTLTRDITYLLSRFSVLAIRFIQNQKLTAAQISALSTSAELLKILAQAGSDRVVANIAARFAPVAQKALQAAKLAGLTPRLDQKALDALVTARATVAVEASIAPLATTVKRAWLDSTFLGTPIKDAIETAVANSATPLEGIARTEIGTALNTVDRAVTLSGAGRESVFVYIGPIDQRTRPTCRIASEYVWQREQIAKLDNGQLPNVFLTCGGWNCRHHWQPLSAKVASALGKPVASNSAVEAYNKAGER